MISLQNMIESLAQAHSSVRSSIWASYRFNLLLRNRRHSESKRSPNVGKLRFNLNFGQEFTRILGPDSALGPESDDYQKFYSPGQVPRVKESKQIPGLENFLVIM
jgi:hypothetical protein